MYVYVGHYSHILLSKFSTIIFTQIYLLCVIFSSNIKFENVSESFLIASVLFFLIFYIQIRGKIIFF